jgi:TfoX/Sxy family transcriptional regulator of competence genes
MAYDEALADRVRQALAAYEGVSERRMFGGLCFMLHGNMAVGVLRDELILRLGEAGGAAALAEAHTRPFDFTGKPMRTTIYLDATGSANRRTMPAWVARAAQFAASLPPKTRKQR